MTPEHTLAFLGFSIVVAGTPGPSNAVLTATGANVGVVRGLPALLALIFVLAALPCCFVWLAFGAVVQRALRSERARRAFNVVLGTLLAASVVLFIR